MKLYLFVLIILLPHLTTGYAKKESGIRLSDKISIKEAMIISKLFGDKIWEGINDVPFTIILVTDSIEFLINYSGSNPGNNFHFLEYDNDLKTKIYSRKRQFNVNLLATFPAVKGVSCVVIGTPENTGKHSTGKIRTI